MLVTILTPAFNSEKTIGRTIESVLNQTYPYVEYIVLDGASSDRTVKVAKEYIDRFEEKGYSIRIISEPDKGMYDALNKGANLAKGELIGQINSDDWYENYAIETMVNLYREKQYDVAWGSIRIKKRTGDMIKHARIGKLWTTSHWCHPAMFTCKKILIQYPYALETMYDDFDFITGLRCAGKKIITTDCIITNFTFGGMSTQKSLKEVKRRIFITYGIYRKYGLSRLYWFERVFIEMSKYLLG